jgi:zinc transporter ZupT
LHHRHHHHHNRSYDAADGDLGTSAYSSAYAADASAASAGGGALTPRRAAAAAAAAAGASSSASGQHRHVVELVDMQPVGASGGAAPSAFAPASAHPPPHPNPASIPTTTVVAARLASGAFPGVSPHHPHSSAPFSNPPGAHDHGIGALAASQAAHKLGFGTALLLAAALCVHSVLEGIALGAQQTLRDTEDIMLAIAAHKGLAAYALGASVVESGASAARFWTVAGLFAGATPVGIFVGLLFSEIGTGAVGAAMSALASGTFLYVAMMEVIPKELADPSHMGLKMSALLLGFGAMSLLAVWA